MPPSESITGQKALIHRALGRPGVAFMLALALCLISLSPAAAEDDPAENFHFSYDPVGFDKSEIHGDEVFHATITGRINCVKDLPMSAKEAKLISRVVAVNTATGTEVILNSNYTVTIKPFPSKKGETAEISQSIPLQFPAQAEPGDYNVVGKTVEAKVKVILAWVDVTGYLPQEQPMGVVKYITTGSTTAPLPSSSTPSATSSSSAPTTTHISPTSPSTSEPAPTATSASWLVETSYPWWFWLIVFIAAAATVFNIIWFRRHRTQKR